MSKDMSILELTVKTRTSTNSVDLNEDLKISIENLNEDFAEQPALFAWYATMYTQAKALVDAKQLAVEKQEDFIKKELVGRLDAKVRQELEMNGEKVTETKVTNAIYTDPEYKEEKEYLYELKEELLQLQSQASSLMIAKEAFVQRKDMLISIGANLRQESNSIDLKIKKQQANEIIRKSIK